MVVLRVLLTVATVALAALAAREYAGQPVVRWLPDLLVGCVALGVGRPWRRATNPVMVLGLLTAATWWAGTVLSEAVAWHRAPLVHLALAAPVLVPARRSAIVLVAVAYVAAVLAPSWGTTGAVAGAAVLTASGLTRRDMRARVAPVLVALALLAGVMVPRLAPPDIAADATAWLYGLLVAAAVLVAGGRRLPTRNQLTDVAVDLGPSLATPDQLLARARTDPALASDADLAAALDRARRLNAAHAQVRDEVRRAIAEVAESRRRLLVASTRERALLAAELDRTSGERLRALAPRVEAAGVPPETVARALAGLDAAVAGLRAPGLDRGVAAAVRALPLAASLGATLMLSEERCDEVVEETCFAVVAEGLSNAAKHAPKAAVEVRFEVVGGVATVAVADDGPGGAAIGAGSGLQGLRDRVEALGGRLEVSPGPARGTEVRTQMPATAPGSPSG